MKPVPPNGGVGEGEAQIAVTAVPDPDKGERIIVLHKPLAKSVDQILKELGEADIPNLWLPSADSFIEVPEIPILGSLFKTTDNTIKRTELLVLLTPRVVKNRQDFADVTEELRSRLQSLLPLEMKIR